MPRDGYYGPEFYQYKETDEHFCPEHWIADPDNEPHEMCSICGKKRMITTAGRIAEVEEEKEPESAQRYEIMQHAPRKSGKEWNGEWVNWASGKGTSQWMSVEKAKSSLRQSRSAPANYQIVRVTYQPEVILDTEVVEEGHDDREADSKFRQVSDADERSTLNTIAGGLSEEFQKEMAKS